MARRLAEARLPPVAGLPPVARLTPVGGWGRQDAIRARFADHHAKHKLIAVVVRTMRRAQTQQYQHGDARPRMCSRACEYFDCDVPTCARANESVEEGIVATTDIARGNV